MVRHSIAIILLPLVLAAPARQFDRRGTAPIYDGSQVNGKTYDYVIAGGGLTGAVLAARLTEDSTKSVLVIESGYNEENNPDVTGKSVESLCLGCLLNGRRIEISKHLRGECSSVVIAFPAHHRPGSIGSSRRSLRARQTTSRRRSAREEPWEAAPPSTAWHGASPILSRQAMHDHGP